MTPQQKNSSNRRAAAAGIHRTGDGENAEADPAVALALTEVGIGKPKRDELARQWSGIPDAAATIRTAAADGTARGKGTGALIAELEARADAARLQLDTNRQAAADSMEARRRAAERAVEDDRQRKAGAAWLAGLSDDEVHELWRRFPDDPRTPRQQRAMLAELDPTLAEIRKAYGEDLARLFGPDAAEDQAA